MQAVVFEKIKRVIVLYRMGLCIVTHLGVTPERASALFGQLLTEHLGGQEAVEVVVRYHEDGVSIRTLAQEHSLTPYAVHTMVHAMRRKLRALGLMPQHWEHRTERGIVK